MDAGADSVADKLRKVGEILDAVGVVGGARPTMSYALLALLGLKPTTPWSDATRPLMGTSPILDFANAEYGTTYAENSRETFRKQGVHPLLVANLIVLNPDDPHRSVNSPRTCYQVAKPAYELFRMFGQPEWEARLETFLESYDTLADQFKHCRTIEMAALRRNLVQPLTLSPGAHSDLIEKAIEEFGSRFTPGGTLAYVGDTGAKWAYFDEELLRGIGIEIEDAGEKMPDVLIVFHRDAGDWLVAVEACHSGGEVNVVRRNQLHALFARSNLPVVLVTAFADRSTMGSRARHIAWETDVLVAEHPDHLVHYNGRHLLQRYESGRGIPILDES